MAVNLLASLAQAFLGLVARTSLYTAAGLLTGAMAGFAAHGFGADPYIIESYKSIRFPRRGKGA